MPPTLVAMLSLDETSGGLLCRISYHTPTRVELIYHIGPNTSSTETFHEYGGPFRPGLAWSGAAVVGSGDDDDF